MKLSKSHEMKWTSILPLAGVLMLAAGTTTFAAADTAAEDLKLTVGKSVVIDYASDIRQISTSNPEIADASPITTRELILHGKGLGVATVIVWNREGQRYFYNVNVEMSLDALRRLLRETFPNEKIQVQSSRDSVSLTGVVSSPMVSERAAAMAASFAKTVINNLSVPTVVEKQIVLKVRFAELSRTYANQFGVNILSTALNTTARVTTGQFPGASVTGSIGGGGAGAATATSFTISDALNIFAFRPDLNLGALIRALQSKGILQILAEPNLVTSNGKEASFLVGGEVPVPVLQGGANAASVTVQFKEFGIRLKFLPVITPNRTIKIDLLQEVSSTDVGHGVSFNGFVIPAITTRRAQTSIELGESQSFIVAGLLDNRDTESFSKIPGIGNVPILGQLFKTRDVSKGLDELVMMVTPEVTSPIPAGDPKPMLDFPNEFLIPVNPVAPPPAKGAGSGAKQSRNEKAADKKAEKSARSSRPEQTSRQASAGSAPAPSEGRPSAKTAASKTDAKGKSKASVAQTSAKKGQEQKAPEKPETSSNE